MFLKLSWLHRVLTVGLLTPSTSSVSVSAASMSRVDSPLTWSWGMRAASLSLRQAFEGLAGKLAFHGCLSLSV